MNAFVVQPTRAEMILHLDIAAPGFGEQIVGILETYTDKHGLYTTTASLDGEAIELMTHSMLVRKLLPRLSTLDRKIGIYEVLEVEAVLMEMNQLWPLTAWTVDDALAKRLEDMTAALESDDDNETPDLLSNLSR